MSDISILNILSGTNASMEAGEAVSAKGQANVDIEALDPELVAQLSSGLKENLLSKKDLPTFESMLMGEEVLTEEKNLTGEKLPVTPEASVEIAPKSNLVSLVGKEESSEQKPLDSQMSRGNPELLSVLAKGQTAKITPMDEAAVAIEMSRPVEVSEMGETAPELPAEVMVKEEISTSPDSKLAHLSGKKINSNLKLVSGEDFISTKNAHKTAPESEVALKAPISEESGELLRTQAELMSTRASSAKVLTNPFMAQNTQLRGSLALSGAMFREALAADSSEGEVAITDEKKDESKITSIPMKDIQGIDPALGLSTRDQVSQTASTDKPVLNLSHIDARKTGDLISEISNYIDRSRLESKGEIDVWVHHKDLGTFQVQAGKSAGTGQNNVDLKIETFSKEGQNFFNQNAPELVKHLQDSGVKVSDFQIKTSALNTLAQSSESSNSQMGRDGNQQSQSNNQSHSGQFAGQNQRQGSESGGDRRRQMWQHYQETYRQRFAS